MAIPYLLLCQAPTQLFRHLPVVQVDPADISVGPNPSAASVMC